MEIAHYRIEGFYNQGSTTGNLEGEITVKESTLEGKIVDRGSRAPQQSVFGRLTDDALYFIKRPQASGLLPLIFVLAPQRDSYKGEWLAVDPVAADYLEQAIRDDPLAEPEVELVSPLIGEHAN